MDGQEIAVDDLALDAAIPDDDKETCIPQLDCLYSLSNDNNNRELVNNPVVPCTNVLKIEFVCETLK